MQITATQKTPDTRSFKNILASTEQLQLQLSPGALGSLVRQVEDRQKEVRQELRETEAELKHAVDSDDLDERGLEEFQERVWLLKWENERLAKRREKLFDMLQERNIEYGISEGFLGARWLEALRWTVLFLIILVITLLAYELIFASSITPHRLWVFFWIDFVACSVFQFEFWLGFRHAKSKTWYWSRHWIDFFTSIPVPPVGVFPLRVFRTIRMVRLFRILRGIRLLGLFWRGVERLEATTDIHVMKRAIVAISVVMIVGTVLVLHLEGEALVDRVAPPTALGTSGPASWYGFGGIVTVPATVASRAELPASDAIARDARPVEAEEPQPWTSATLAGINTNLETTSTYLEKSGQTLWWTFTTVFTGGYADIFNPRSSAGRMLTAFLTVMGIVVVAVLTSTLTSVFVGADSRDAILRQRDLEQKIDAMRDSLKQHRDTTL